MKRILIPCLIIALMIPSFASAKCKDWAEYRKTNGGCMNEPSIIIPKKEELAPETVPSAVSEMETPRQTHKRRFLHEDDMVILHMDDGTAYIVETKSESTPTATTEPSSVGTESASPPNSPEPKIKESDLNLKIGTVPATPPVPIGPNDRSCCDASLEAMTPD